MDLYRWLAQVSNGQYRRGYLRSIERLRCNAITYCGEGEADSEIDPAFVEHWFFSHVEYTPEQLHWSR